MAKRLSREEKQHIVDLYWQGETVINLSRQYHVSESTVYEWLKKCRTAQTKPKDMDCLKKRYLDLQRHCKKMSQKLEILDRLHLTDEIPLDDKLILFEELKGSYSGNAICEALGISKGTYHNRILHYHDPVYYDSRRNLLKAQIKEIFEESEARYGSDKILAVLNRRGIHTSKKMILRLMREMNLKSIGVHAKKLYKESVPKENLLQRDFTAQHPNQIWVSDITQLKVLDSIFFICIILDLFSRRVVGYKIAQSATTQMVTSTFKAAFESRERPNNLTFHSDQGTQYTSYSFRKLLEDCQVRQSFSRPGQPHDNAVAESFNAILKKEELYRRIYRSEREFRQSIDEFMDYYNNARPHRHNNYKSPAQAEDEYQKTD